MKLIVIIPAFNEEKTIKEVVSKIPKINKRISQTEVIVLDDGSRDNTDKLAKEAGAVVISYIGNKGVGVAFRTGIESALRRQADIIVNIDGDGQFNPNDIPKLIEPILNKEADFVTATRFKDGNLIGNMPWIKKVGNKAFTKLTSFLVGQKFTDTQCGFRAYSRESALRLNLYGKFTYTQEVFLDLANKGLIIKEIPLLIRAEREFGKSKVVKSIPKYVFQALTIIIRSIRDYKPLAFFGVIGISVFGLGFLIDLVLFIRWLITGTVTPYTTGVVIGVVFIILGVLLVVLALIADMLDRQRRIEEDLLYYRKKEEFR